MISPVGWSALSTVAHLAGAGDHGVDRAARARAGQRSGQHGPAAGGLQLLRHGDQGQVGRAGVIAGRRGGRGDHHGHGRGRQRGGLELAGVLMVR